MSVVICDFRFSICDLGRMFRKARFVKSALSLTPRFSGVCRLLDCRNRFSCFQHPMETAEAVQAIHCHRPTLLKQSANETNEFMCRIAHEIRRPLPKHLPRPLTCLVQSQIANLQSQIPHPSHSRDIEFPAPIRSPLAVSNKPMRKILLIRYLRLTSCLGTLAAKRKFNFTQLCQSPLTSEDS